MSWVCTSGERGSRGSSMTTSSQGMFSSQVMPVTMGRPSVLAMVSTTTPRLALSGVVMRRAGRVMMAPLLRESDCRVPSVPSRKASLLVPE